MVELTIAVASAWIAAGIAIFQFVLPNALALVLTSLLSDEQPAVTWSVVSRFFLSSDWPLFLRSEAATASGVSRSISLVTWTKPIGLFFIAVAAIVTPLGLYDEVAPARYSEMVPFSYVVDEGLIGAGTPSRSNRANPFSRACSGWLCPGDPDLGNVTLAEITNTTTNETEPFEYRIMSQSINPTLMDFYQKGTQSSSPSLSNYFDIQARQWTTWTGNMVDQNGSLIAADWKYLSSVFMDNKLELVEGLIVDTKDGGIGFRNHSVPSTFSQYGAEWEEDILWWQPDTVCVDTNLTLSWTGVLSSITEYADVVDRGGFCELQKVNPYYTELNTTRDYIFADAQKNPFLYERAFFLAWYYNSVAMEYLNITDPMTNRSRVSSAMNQHFKVNGTLNRIGSYDDQFFKLYRGGQLISLPSMFSWNATSGDYGTGDYNPEVPNPYNVTGDDLSDHLNYCAGALGGDKVNISRLDVSVGFIAGPALLVNRSDPNNASSQETWERPYYACTSATKASIKTVRFRYNSTRELALNNLEIMEIKDKVYASDSDKPMWGFETPWQNATMTWNLSMINPLWGLMSPQTPTSRDVALFQSDRFYIPASYGTYQYSAWDNEYAYQSFTPGTTGSAMSWNLVYSSGSATDGFSGADPQVLRFIQERTGNSSSMASLMNLMWTDNAANAVVGTRGVHQARYQPLNTLSRRDSNDPFSSSDYTSLPTGQYPVYHLERRIRYHWVYGIPAFICLTVIVAVCMLAFVALICGQGTITRLRWYMFHSTSGRVLASHVYPETAHHKSAETRGWLNEVGTRPIVVSTSVGYSTGFQRERSRTIEKGATPYIQIQQKEEGDSISLRPLPPQHPPG